MPCYKIEKLGVARYLNFANLTDAQNYANSLGVGFIATLESSEDFPPINLTVSQKALQDKYFLLGLVEDFVSENRTQGPTTVAQDLELLSAFSNIKQLAEVGAISATKQLLVDLTGLPIAGIYTEQRREIDILRIDSYNDTL